MAQTIKKIKLDRKFILIEQLKHYMLLCDHETGLSTNTEELLDHCLVSGLDVLGLILVAVHDECHAERKHKHFAILDMLCVASLG
jgi:hypothetical protein